MIEDAPHVDQARRAYSPFGISYGFCADLFNNVAAATLLGHPPLRGGLEEMFVGHGQGDVEGRLACADAWHRLPTRAGEREHFDHSPEWAGRIFGELMRALESRAARPRDSNASDTPAVGIAIVADSPNAQEHCFTSDVNLAGATGATPHPVEKMISDRSEGRFLASAETNGHWFGEKGPHHSGPAGGGRAPAPRLPGDRDRYVLIFWRYAIDAATSSTDEWRPT